MTNISELLTLTPPGICLCTSQYEILFAEKNFLRIFEYTDSQKKPATLNDIISLEGVNCVKDTLFNSSSETQSAILIPLNDLLLYSHITVLGVRLPDDSGKKNVLLFAISANEIMQHEDAIERALLVLHKFQGLARHGTLNSLTGLFLMLSLLEDESAPISESPYIGDFHKLLNQIKNISEYSRHYKNLGQGGPVWHDTTQVHLEISRMNQLLYKDIDNSCNGLFVFADPCYAEAMDVVFRILKETSDPAMEPIMIKAKEENSVLTISYENEGEGIPENDKETIFNETYYGKSELALFFAQQIFSITKISIIENGTEGIGTRFLIKFPLQCFRRKDEAN